MGDFMKTKGGFVVNRPGRVLFVPVLADGTLDYANAKRNTSVINTITATNSRTKTEIPDGNNFYAAGDRVTAITGTIAIEFSTIDPIIWAMASGSELKKEATGTMTKIYDYMKISDEDGTIILPDTYKTGGYINVLCSDGTEFEKVEETTSGAGEYVVGTEEPGKTSLTFNAADKGKNVAITMEVTKKIVSYSQGKESMKYHKLIIDTDFSTLGNTDNMSVNIEVSQVSLSGDMVEALQKDPSALKTLTFNMYAPLPGEEPYQIKIEDKTTA